MLPNPQHIAPLSGPNKVKPGKISADLFPPLSPEALVELASKVRNAEEATRIRKRMEKSQFRGRQEAEQAARQLLQELEAELKKADDQADRQLLHLRCTEGTQKEEEKNETRGVV